METDPILWTDVISLSLSVRTLEYLIRHLAGLATCSGETNMHIKNLAIVWAPNLLRSMEIEAVGLSGADPFKEVRIQSVVVEFLLGHVDVLFSDSFTSVGRFTGTGTHITITPTLASLTLTGDSPPNWSSICVEKHTFPIEIDA
uniref:Rho-GAP domain-containing protein n=1 Tax=Hucho hucho TaxID=62062 RepID=A0A4W5P348_9TELE